MIRHERESGIVIQIDIESHERESGIWYIGIDRGTRHKIQVVEVANMGVA